jgi:diadenosine tetraphosphate (Ap4A) HIT family hydrolase
LILEAGSHSPRYHPDVPLTPDEFYEHALSAADAEGRLPLSRMTGWEIFPFEPDGLRVVPLARPVIPEPARTGESGDSCGGCSTGRGVIWENPSWRLSVPPDPTGAPMLMLLLPKEHHDLGDLPDDLAGDLGRLIVHIGRAIESLPHIARAHVSRWGDGGAHLHVFFFARPEGFGQLRGTCMAVWDDLLPPLPHQVRDDDAAAVARALSASFGGTTVHSE